MGQPLQIHNLEKGTKKHEMYINEQKHTSCIIRI